jgi:hypothetical protein
VIAANAYSECWIVAYHSLYSNLSYGRGCVPCMHERRTSTASHIALISCTASREALLVKRYGRCAASDTAHAWSTASFTSTRGIACASSRQWHRCTVKRAAATNVNRMDAFNACVC